MIGYQEIFRQRIKKTRQLALSKCFKFENLRNAFFLITKLLLLMRIFQKTKKDTKCQKEKKMGYKEWKLNDRLKSLVGKFGASYFVQSSRYFINSKLRKLGY